MSEAEFQDIFKPIIDQVVWGAEQGYGSFLTLEFGLPKIGLSSVRKPSADSKFPFDTFDSRDVTIKGEHSFLLFMSNWKILAGKTELAYDESNREKISFALSFIEGQKLQTITVEPRNNTTVLQFDLGGVISISNEDYGDDLHEMWKFHTNNERILTYRNDRKAWFGEGIKEPMMESYSEVKYKVTCPTTSHEK